MKTGINIRSIGYLARRMIADRTLLLVDRGLGTSPRFGLTDQTGQLVASVCGPCVRTCWVKDNLEAMIDGKRTIYHWPTR